MFIGTPYFTNHEIRKRLFQVSRNKTGSKVQGSKRRNIQFNQL